MDFAKKQLEKYGWSEGKGLGKNEDGISSALKPKRKADQRGLGHDPGRDFTEKWWEHVFNEAAGSIKVDVKDGDVQIKTTTTAKASSLRHPNLEYTSFIKTSKLTGATTEPLFNSISVENVSNSSKSLTDEELFMACSNRTAHKGARHGIRQNGKLSRIEKQEKMLLKKLKKVKKRNEDEKKSKKNRVC